MELSITVIHGRGGSAMLVAAPRPTTTWQLGVGHAIRRLRVTDVAPGRYNVHVEMTDGRVWENAFADVSDEDMTQLVDAVKAANAELQRHVHSLPRPEMSVR